MKAEIEPILKIRKLTLGYEGEAGRVIAIDNLDLDISRGKISSIVGESGSGKSTIANAIIGFIKYPAIVMSGSIEFNGQDILTLSTSKIKKLRMKKISFVPQSAMNSLNPVMKIRDQMHDIIEAHEKMEPKKEMEVINTALKTVNLPEYVLDSYQNQISGGMKQRVMIAIASLLDPDIMILDEPTTGLDVVVQKSILDSIKTINAEKGITVILITHDLPVAFYVSDFTSILYSGKIVEQGIKDTLVSQKLHPYTELLIGSIPSATDSKKRLTTIKGSITPIFESQKTCAFTGRCPYAIEECGKLPLVEYRVNNELVRCLRYDPTLKAKFERSLQSSEKAMQIPLRTGVISKISGTENHRAELQNAVVKFIIGRGSAKKEIVAVNGVSISIESGKITAVVGASGSGKTTIGKVLLFDEYLNSGKYMFDNRDVSKPHGREVKDRRRLIQMIFQDPFSSLSLLHKIGYQLERPLLINGLSTKKSVRDDVLQVLSLVGLRPAESFIDKYPYELSGGQRQRVCIGKALSVGAKLLVADEPVSMLDASVRAEILNLIVDLKNQLNLGVLYITHDLSTVKYVADVIYVMKEGSIVEHGDWNRIFTSPQEEYTKVLLGSIV